ncbi:MAG: hypothetical protein IT464_06570 [Planctomycetes bacterium]|nr:hypothetical protein [Planctomycetota bacterium]
MTGCRKPIVAAAKPRAVRVLVLMALFSVGCAVSGPVSPVPQGAPVTVLPVKNLSGVTLNVPELYMGDAGEKAAGLEVDKIDLRLLAEAGLAARLGATGHDPGGGEYEIHAGVSVFDMTELRRTGRIKLGLALVVVDSKTQTVIAESEAEQDCQLLDKPPSETGIIGEQRFLRQRLEMFMEALAREALILAGL